MKKYYGLRGNKLQYAIGGLAGIDFMLFGYDQGVVGGLLTLHTFLSTFPEINTNAPNLSHSEKNRVSTYQGISVASYTLGCFFGAIITIFVGNFLGRRKTILVGSSIMIVGAILQASAFSLPHLIVGRIITGIGNGLNTSTVPTWQSETSKSHRRGRLVMIEGALITFGVMMSYWVDFAFSFAPGDVSWRFPIAFQLVFCLTVVSLIMGLPESPRWLVLKGREEEAQEVLCCLFDLPPEDPYIRSEFQAIKDTVLEMSKGTFRDLFTMGPDRNFHRVVLAYVNQMFQQISGINIITYYAATLFSNLGLSSVTSRALAAANGTEYFAASWISVFTIEKVGRRKLMLFGATGQAATMVILAGTASATGNKGAEITGAVMLFVFNTFFAIGWLGMTWLYPAEIVPLRIRAPANAVSTSANWLFNFLIVMITPVSFSSIGYKTYVYFAIINAFIVPCVYFFYPETAYRSLEEMDHIFEKTKNVFTVVKTAAEEPYWYDKQGVMIINYEEIENETIARRRNSAGIGRNASFAATEKKESMGGADASSEEDVERRGRKES